MLVGNQFIIAGNQSERVILSLAIEIDNAMEIAFHNSGERWKLSPFNVDFERNDNNQRTAMHK